MRDAGLHEYAKYAVAVAKHETANFRSKIFLEKKNAFGMKMPDLSGYKKYGSVYESASDFAGWLLRKKITSGLDISGFVGFMKMNGYFEDNYQSYLNGVKSWQRKI